MKKVIALSADAEIVFSKDEAGYEEVIQSFKDAKRVTIVTYNISTKRNSRLLAELRKLGPQVEVAIICNIPKRFPFYTNDYARAKASQTIDEYLNTLDPTKYVSQLRAFFQYDNHCKLVATEALAYMGSSNFSDESAGNFECGVILRNPRIIDQLVATVLEGVKTNADEHGGNVVQEAIIRINTLKRDILAMKELVHEAFYIPEDWDYGTIPEHFNSHECRATRAQLDAIGDLLEALDGVLREIAEVPAAEPIIDGFEWDRLEAVRHLIRWDGPLDVFVRHDSRQFGSEYLEETIYDDYDQACQDAADLEGEHLDALADAAEPEVTKIEAQFAAICVSLTAVTERLRGVQIETPGVDNTK